MDDVWAGGFPVFAAEASGARIVDVDGHEYVDLCLGDTGAMPGHGPPVVVEAVREQLARGITTMLPTEDAIWVGEELARRFGMQRWLFTLTATDANRTALRAARQLTGRPFVAVFSYCYHGSVDEAFAVSDAEGLTHAREGNVGPPVDPALTTRAIEFNDVEALRAALADGLVACVLAEPAMTNMGIILPEPGYHEALRELTRAGRDAADHRRDAHVLGRAGRLHRRLGARARPADDRQGDRLRRALGGARVLGRVAAALLGDPDADYEDTGGVGGTLAGNALSAAAMRATLEHVLTADAFAHTSRSPTGSRPAWSA